MPMVTFRCLCLLIILHTTLQGCGGSHDSASPPESPTTVIYIIVDGLRWDAFWQVMQTESHGEIDALAEIFGPRLNRSFSFTETYTTFPAITFTANATLVTGLPPADHGIAGNSFFNRQTSTDHRLADPASQSAIYQDGLAQSLLTAPTFYDLSASEAMAFFHMFGPETGWLRPAVTDGLWYLTSPAYYDNLATLRLLSALAKRDPSTPLPRILTLYWPGLDVHSHDTGAAGQGEYITQTINRNLRTLLDGVPGHLPGLKSYGNSDTFAFVLTADHGMQDVKRWIAPGEILGSLHDILQTVPGYADHDDHELRHAVQIAPNGGMAHVYLKTPTGEWQNPASNNQNQTLEDIANALRDVESLSDKLDLVLAVSGPAGHYRVCLGKEHGCVDAEEYFEILRPWGNRQRYLRPIERLRGLTGIGGDILLTSNYDQHYAFLEANPTAGGIYKSQHGNLMAPLAETTIPLVVAGPGVAAGTMTSPHGIADAPRIVMDLAGSPLPNQPLADYRSGGHQIVVSSTGPIDLALEDPLGRTIRPGQNTIPDASYLQAAGGQIGSDEDRITIALAETGTYTLSVTPTTEDDNRPYGITFRHKGQPHILAENFAPPLTVQEFSFLATDLPPEFLSAPQSWAVPDIPYHYRPAVRDPEDTALSFTLLEGPSGMTIATDSGTLAWSPSLDDLGEHPVSVEARDSAGNISNQRFQIQVGLPAPVGISARYENDAVNLDWQTIAGAAAYIVQRVYDTQQQHFEIQVQDPEYSDSQPPQDTTIGYIIYGVDSEGRLGEASAMARVKTTKE